ncbi:Hypothetical protein FKW44_021705, partial [Caligus rogercresseyi]
MSDEQEERFHQDMRKEESYREVGTQHDGGILLVLKRDNTELLTTRNRKKTPIYA